MGERGILESDHREIDVLLAELDQALGEGDRDKVFLKLDFFWARLAMHIRAEHLHLFPALLRSAGHADGTRELIERLHEDHDFFMHELAESIKIVRSAEDGREASGLRAVSEKVAKVARRLKDHNAVEEARVYPLITELFDATEAERLQAAIKHELEKLPARFKELSKSD